MKLLEALTIIKRRKQPQGEPFTCFLATGLNSLHLSSFLAAELSLLFPDRKVELQHGLYGDLQGNVNRLSKANADAGVVLLEWTDLDARLGVRSSSAWSPAICADIVATLKSRTWHIQQVIEAASARMPVIVSFPTLPLPPASFVPGWQAGPLEVELNTITHDLRSRISQLPQVRVLSPQRLDIVSPLHERFDVESELLTGFPYRLPHASALANLLAQLTRKPSPKKGLITDLDDTLWRGILGEIGVEGISWDLDHHTQMHAFYQRVLGAFAAEGVLLGVASKNERALVETALRRKDLALSPDVFFPLEVSWGRKSDGVARILKTWNIGADSVIFVDDSPLELAEVKASHPAVECIQFPTKDSAAVYDLAYRLRDLFGRSTILEEDAIRAQSIRRSGAAAETYEIASGSENFLEQVQAEISINFSKSPLDPRALELVNKTNQFNLNGKRFTEVAWQNYIRDPGSFLAIVSYTDKFGPLGRIAVMTGRSNERELIVDAWVMSCRAFSRRIEHACLRELFTKFGADTIKLDFLTTDRNGPLREFLKEILGAAPEPYCAIPRQLFEARYKMAQEPQEIANG